MKSPWTILILGVLAFGLIALAMIFTLDRFQETPAGNRAKIANEIRENFRFEAVNVDRTKEGERETLVVTYTTETVVEDATELESQMRSVAVYAFQKCDEKDREEVDRAHVVRRERRHSGCDTQIKTDEYRMKNPELEKLFK